MKQRVILIGFLVLGLVGVIFTTASMLLAICKWPDRAFVMAKGFDQLTNTGLHGNEDELISSRMGKAVRDGRCMGCFWLCRLLHLLDKNHCKKSIEDDEG